MTVVVYYVTDVKTNNHIELTCFVGVPALLVAITLLVDVDSYRYNTD